MWRTTTDRLLRIYDSESYIRFSAGQAASLLFIVSVFSHRRDWPLVPVVAASVHPQSRFWFVPMLQTRPAAPLRSTCPVQERACAFVPPRSVKLQVKEPESAGTVSCCLQIKSLQRKIILNAFKTNGKQVGLSINVTYQWHILEEVWNFVSIRSLYRQARVSAIDG